MHPAVHRIIQKRIVPLPVFYYVGANCILLNKFASGNVYCESFIALNAKIL